MAVTDKMVLQARVGPASAPLLPGVPGKRRRKAGADDTHDGHAGKTHGLPLQAGSRGQQWRDYSEVGVDRPLKF